METATGSARSNGSPFSSDARWRANARLFENPLGEAGASAARAFSVINNSSRPALNKRSRLGDRKNIWRYAGEKISSVMPIRSQFSGHTPSQADDGGPAI